MRRKDSFAFMDSSTSSKASICQSCYENNITSKLEVYTKDPQHFMICPYCHNIVSKKAMRFESETQPLGYKGGHGPVNFEVAEFSKRRRIRHREENDVFDVNDYKLPNGELDKDLVHYASQGFIVSVQDTGNDAEEPEEY